MGFLSEISIKPASEIAPKIVIEVLRAEGKIALTGASFFDQPLLRVILMWNKDTIFLEVHILIS